MALLIKIKEVSSLGCMTPVINIAYLPKNYVWLRLDWSPFPKWEYYYDQWYHRHIKYCLVLFFIKGIRNK